MILSIINLDTAEIVAMIIASVAGGEGYNYRAGNAEPLALRAMFDAVTRRSAATIVRHAQASTASVATPPQTVKEIRK
jgi:hypothetical protein